MREKASGEDSHSCVRRRQQITQGYTHIHTQKKKTHPGEFALDHGKDGALAAALAALQLLGVGPKVKNLEHRRVGDDVISVSLELMGF